ncbi:uncharacterized protein LOC119765542 [Culex quinquefasciatus]|uniref:uncharacterized protein LOC119765542 n=1 Tax=Culex quinquefasciatus TaxID=7176 RepID=UPI0018E2A2E3|nr:uncharacterized protein LOC119765542 [Culex quinquefasciatus]
MRKFWDCISKKGSSNRYSIPNIQSLPDGVLQTIFLNLDFASRKAATLVCHRWNRLAFHPETVILTVDLYPFTHRNIVPEATFRRRLLASRRPYRNLDLIVCQRDFVVDILRKFSHCLKFLRLQCRFEKEHVREVLDLCPNLAALDITNSIFIWEFHEKVALRPLTNLQQLRANYSFRNLSDHDFRILFPTLTELTIRHGIREVDLGYYSRNLTRLEVVDCSFKHDDSIWNMEFPRLEHFKLHADFYDSASTESSKVEHFLSRCGDLKTISLKRVTGIPNFIQNLALICPNLKELTLETCCKFPESLSENFWHYVLALQHLEQFGLQLGDVVLTIPPITNTLPKLTSLRHLALRSYKVSHVASLNRFLEHVFPALTHLQIMSSPEIVSPENVPFPNLKNLQTLHLIDRSDAYQHLTPQQAWRSLHCKFLSGLQSLPALSELIIDFQKFHLENITPALTNIRTVASSCDISRKQWEKLATLMPNLTAVKLGFRNYGVADDRMGNAKMARKLFPKCRLESYCRCRKRYELPKGGQWVYRDSLKGWSAIYDMY